VKLSGKQLYGAAVFALVLPTGWAFSRWVSSLLAQPPDRPSAFHGTRLGMSVTEVRATFVAASGAAAAGPAGTFSARPNGPSGWALDWRAGSSAGTVRQATFEFHEGLLVAVRAEIDRADELASTPRTTVTPGTVRRVTPRGDANFDVLILARSCPEHAEEVRNLLRTP
jgi:hypothetical protein